MNIKNLFLSAICYMVVIVGVTSCVEKPNYDEYKVTEYYEEDNNGTRDYNNKISNEYWIIYNIEGNTITYCKGYTSKVTEQFEILERSDKGLFIRKLMSADSEGHTRYVYYRLVKTNRRVYFIS